MKEVHKQLKLQLKLDDVNKANDLINVDGSSEIREDILF